MIDEKKDFSDDINTIEDGKQLEYDNAKDFGEPVKEAQD